MEKHGPVAAPGEAKGYSWMHLSVRRTGVDEFNGAGALSRVRADHQTILPRIAQTIICGS